MAKTEYDDLGSWATDYNRSPEAIDRMRRTNRARYRAMQRVVRLHRADFERIFAEEKRRRS